MLNCVLALHLATMACCSSVHVRCVRSVVVVVRNKHKTPDGDSVAVRPSFHILAPNDELAHMLPPKNYLRDNIAFLEECKKRRKELLSSVAGK